MSEKCKSTSPGPIQVKKISERHRVLKKLDIISRLQKGEQIVDICRNVRLTHSSVHTIHDNAERKKVLYMF